MRIGLVRHFKVNCENPQFNMTSSQFEDWIRQYDEAEIFHTDKQRTEIKWDLCYSSDFPRAVHTAEKIASCQIVETPLLREVPLTAFFKTRRKLPFPIWNLVGRLAWLVSQSSQPETRKESRERAREFLDLISKKEKKNSLVVSHGFFLYVLAKELKRQGYKGPRKRRFENGGLYIYEKEQST